MNLADPLRLLLEHGLQSNQYTNQPTPCVPMWSNAGCVDDGKDCGAWKVIMHYYRLKVSVWSTHDPALGPTPSHDPALGPPPSSSPFMQGGDDLSRKPEQMLLLSFSLQPEQCSLKKVCPLNCRWGWSAAISLPQTLIAAVHKVEKSFGGCYVKSPDTKVTDTPHVENVVCSEHNDFISSSSER